jgi:lysylphosphatidylglycerol synthetase-like protein (DUF2156 family)
MQPGSNVSWMDADYAEIAASAGQYVPSLIGAALLVLSAGLSQRVTLAWGTTIGLLIAAAAFTAVQGAAGWVPAVLAVTALLLLPFREAYYRHARLISAPLRAGTAMPLFALVVCVLALASLEPRVRWLAGNSWIDLALSPDVPGSLRLVMLLAMVLGLFALYRLIRPGRVRWLPWTGEGRQRYAALGAVPPAEADGFVAGESGRAGIPFRRVGPVLLGLGDPAGSANYRLSAIWNLRDLAQQEGRDPAVWRAGPDLLKAYEDLGLTALPLGADGLPLAETAEGTGRAAQYLCLVAERDLSALLPLLPDLARAERDMARAAE